MICRLIIIVIIAQLFTGCAIYQSVEWGGYEWSNVVEITKKGN